MSTITEAQTIFDIPTSLIRPDPAQPRKEFDPEYIAALGESIAAEGLLQPITVRPDPEKAGAYIIIAGECRWRAHCHKGLQSVRCMVATDKGDEKTRFRAQVMENMGRQNMTFRDEMAAVVRLRDWGDDAKTIGRSLGLSTYRVENILKLAAMPDFLLTMINMGAINRMAAEYAAARVPEGELERMLKSIAGKSQPAAHLLVNSYVDQHEQDEFSLVCESIGLGAKAKNESIQRLLGVLFDAGKQIEKLTTDQQFMLGRQLSKQAAEHVHATKLAIRSTSFLSNFFINVGTELKGRKKKLTE